MKKIVVIDNYDSFTYNLVHAIDQLTGEKTAVFRNDQIALKDLDPFDKIVLSPGPGIPDEAGMLKEIIQHFAPDKSILGVCLGHQAIAEVFGGKLLNIHKVFHGVSTKIKVLNDRDYLFRDVPDIFEGGRYHSWIVSGDNLPDCFTVSAVAEDGEIMAISHNTYDVKGVQFHPESVLTEMGEKIISNWINRK